MSASMDEAPPPRLHAIRTTLGFAVLVATIFVAWTPQSFSAESLSDRLALLLTPQPAVGQIDAGPARAAHRDRGGSLRERFRRHLRR